MLFAIHRDQRRASAGDRGPATNTQSGFGDQGLAGNPMIIPSAPIESPSTRPVFSVNPFYVASPGVSDKTSPVVVEPKPDNRYDLNPKDSGTSPVYVTGATDYRHDLGSEGTGASGDGSEGSGDGSGESALPWEKGTRGSGSGSEGEPAAEAAPAKGTNWGLWIAGIVGVVGFIALKKSDVSSQEEWNARYGYGR